MTMNNKERRCTKCFVEEEVALSVDSKTCFLTPHNFTDSELSGKTGQLAAPSEGGWEEELLNLQGTDLENTQIELPLEGLKNFIASIESASILRTREKVVREILENLPEGEASIQYIFADCRGFIKNLREVIARDYNILLD